MKKRSLAVKMFIAMILGLVVGIGFLTLRESLISSGQAGTWTMINNLLFQDVTAEGAEQALGIFYIIGQLFVNALQLIMIPMVFVSIVLAVGTITDTKKLGRISMKTIGFFLGTKVLGIALAASVGMIIYQMGLFNTVVDGLAVSAGSTGSNPMAIILKVVPNNIVSVFGDNGRVLSIVFLAVVVGLTLNKINSKTSTIKNLCEELNKVITVFLGFIVNKFGPITIFCLLSRTFAMYGVSHLKPALTYIITVVLSLLFFLLVVYPTIIVVLGKVSPIPFIKKIAKVAVFAFSTSSSAATLPLNQKTATEELGISEEVASFILPLGMTINMDGTAIMQVIATIFIAGCAGYELTITTLLLIGVLALVASIATPGAPGAGAVILFTILTGIGLTSEAALIAYSLILAINRPVEMLVTVLNVVDDSVTAIVVGKSEGALNEEIYNATEKAITERASKNVS